MSRRNPTLLILGNPETIVPQEREARKTWGKFHLKKGDRAQAMKIPDIPGLPKTVVVIGALSGVEVVSKRWDEDAETISWKHSHEGGPWLVTDSAGKRLWIVATGVKDLADVPTKGYVRAVSYNAPKHSGKYDAVSDRSWRHHMGEGLDEMPEDRWPECYPTLRGRGRYRAFVDGTYTVEPRGIVG